MVQIQRKGFDLMEKKLFGKTCEMGQIILKIVLLHKTSNIPKKRSFSDVLKHFRREVTKKNFS